MTIRNPKTTINNKVRAIEQISLVSCNSLKIFDFNDFRHSRGSGRITFPKRRHGILKKVNKAKFGSK